MSGDASHGEQPAAIERYIAVEIKDELGGATVAYGAAKIEIASGALTVDPLPEHVQGRLRLLNIQGNLFLTSERAISTSLLVEDPPSHAMVQQAVMMTTMNNQEIPVVFSLFTGYIRYDLPRQAVLVTTEFQEAATAGRAAARKIAEENVVSLFQISRGEALFLF